MTFIAVTDGVAQGQRKGAVVDGGRFPAWVGGMAVGTCVGDTDCCVVGICGPVVVCKVTRNTFVRCIIIIPVMTFVAIIDGMAQRERERGMVKRGWFPARVCVVTIGTGVGKACGHVVGICSPVVVFQVA